MNNTFLYFIFILFILWGCGKKPEFSDWQGPTRDGIFQESNLLKKWPENGPEMLWSFEGLGAGHSSVAVANQKVYVTGIKDTILTTGTLFAFDFSGNLL